MSSSSEAEKKGEKKTSKDALGACRWAKEMYERCFNRWYRYQYLRGHLYRECDEYFDEYRACLMEEFSKLGLVNIDGFDEPDFDKVKLDDMPSKVREPEKKVSSPSS